MCRNSSLVGFLEMRSACNVEVRSSLLAYRCAARFCTTRVQQGLMERKHGPRLTDGSQSEQKTEFKPVLPQFQRMNVQLPQLVSESHQNHYFLDCPNLQVPNPQRPCWLAQCGQRDGCDQGENSDGQRVSLRQRQQVHCPHWCL